MSEKQTQDFESYIYLGYDVVDSEGRMMFTQPEWKAVYDGDVVVSKYNPLKWVRFSER